MHVLLIKLKIIISVGGGGYFSMPSILLQKVCEVGGWLVAYAHHPVLVLLTVEYKG
jgi:hypothetical protein